jgi:hypothetical protein
MFGYFSVEQKMLDFGGQRYTKTSSQKKNYLARVGRKRKRFAWEMP